MNSKPVEPRAGLLALGPAETAARVAEMGGRPFHAKILREAVFQKGATDFDGLTSLPAGLRKRLSDELPVLVGEEVTRRTSRDGATKLLLRFGDVTVETVHIPSARAGRGATLCVSTQAGCPVACPFCASGKDGLARNLSTGEILEQFVRGAAIGPLSRSVVMGIGEPLLNIESTRAALEVVRREMGIGARKITLSTVGFPDRLAELARSEPHFQLAISLHSPDDDQRAKLVPAMAGTSVEEVLLAGYDWFAQTGREVTYEYVVLGGYNDSPAHAERLGRRLRGRRATVNLIPYNPVEGDPWRRPHKDRVAEFQAALDDAGVVATIRWSRGLEEDAACGQLRLGASAG